MEIRKLTSIVAVFMLLCLSGCSSEEIDNPTAREFKTTAADLNSHIEMPAILPDGLVTSRPSIVAHDYPSKTYYVWAPVDVMEIPAKGGAYDFDINLHHQLTELRIYEDMPLLKHNAPTYNEYDNKYGECLAYEELISKREGPDASVAFSRINEANASIYGILQNASEKDRNAIDGYTFTYTFPENHTGKYRLICIGYQGPRGSSLQWEPDEEEIRDWTLYFIQMPD